MLLKKLSKHVRSMFKNGSNIHASIINEAKYAISMSAALTPADPNNPTPDEQVQLCLFKKRLNMLVKHEDLLNANIKYLYSLVLGQCTNLLQMKLKQQATWANIKTNYDGIILLNLIKTVVYHFKT